MSLLGVGDIVEIRGARDDVDVEEGQKISLNASDLPAADSDFDAEKLYQ